MSTYVQNVVTIRGDRKKIEAVVALIRKPDGVNGECIDFNKIIPMPASLDFSTAGADTDDALAAYALYKKKQERDCSAYDVVRNYMESGAHILWFPQLWCLVEANWNLYFREDDHIPFETADPSRLGKESLFRDYIACGKIFYDNLVQYGAVNWFEWRAKNWGTKCNPSDCHFGQIEEDDAGEAINVSFEVPWAPPMPIFKRLSELFPDLVFCGGYASKSPDLKCGTFSLQNGKFLCQTATEKDMQDPVGFAYAIWWAFQRE